MQVVEERRHVMEANPIEKGRCIEVDTIYVTTRGIVVPRRVEVERFFIYI